MNIVYERVVKLVDVFFLDLRLDFIAVKVRRNSVISHEGCIFFVLLGLHIFVYSASAVFVS